MTETRQDAVFTNKGPLRSNSLKNQAYEQIKDAILYRRLKTNIVYAQDEICQKLGISRTPVREALIALESEGYITFVRGRGFQVNELTKKEGMDIVELRREIELFGAELAAERIDDAQLAKLRQISRQMEEAEQNQDSGEMYKLDFQFHNLIFEATGNSWLQEVHHKLRENFLRVENQNAFEKPSVARKVFREHEKVIEALETRNPTLARRAMKNHMDHTYKRTLVKLFGKEQAEAAEKKR